MAARAQMAALYASESDRAALETIGRLKDRADTMTTNLTVHHRAMDVDAVVKGGTVEGLLVPWDSPTWVADDMPNGKQDIYQEGFRRTAFDDQFEPVEKMRSNAPRVMFRHMHARDEGFGPLGFGREFEVRDDGLWGAFHVIKGQRDTLADLVDGGIKRLSIEFRERPDGTVEEDGIRWRTGVLLAGVALEWAGAYPEAQVLAMRSALEGADRERAEREQAERVERERVEAEARVAAAQAEAERAELDAAVARHRRTEEMAAWLAEQEREQASLAARYG